MNRAEHLAFCKRNALQYTDPKQAIACFASDVARHPETANIEKTIGMLAIPLLAMGKLNTPEALREHIEGYN
jgi:hypothetical protein